MSDNLYDYTKPDSYPAFRKRMQHLGKCTVTDLLDWLTEHDLCPDDVAIMGVDLRWIAPETPEEHDRWVQAGIEARERQEKWERETLERLLNKYGPPPSMVAASSGRLRLDEEPPS